jgi:alcohol dehydrogenase class IV
MDQIFFEQIMRPNALIVPRRIVFGKDAAKNVGEEAVAIGGGKVLLVTDAGVLNSGMLTDVTKALRAKGLQVHIFSDVEPEPDVKTADRIASTVREGEFNLVCGVGGGSALDIAKIASIMATNSGQVKEYVGTNLVKKPGLPKILLPTTSGTGSEMTPNAILGFHDEGLKAGVVSPYVLADTAIVDPALTLSLPPKPTASSGIDALAHAIESYISVDANPITDLFSLRAIELIARNLRVAFSKGTDLQARAGMSLAAMIAGISIANAGTCSGHAAAYGYAAKHKIPHGFSVGVALPHIMEFSLVSCPEKGTAITRAMGEDTSRLSSAEVIIRAVKAVVQLMKEVNCPTSLSQLGIERSEIPTMAQDMLKTKRLLVHNPRPVNDRDAIEIITKMWEGKLDENVKQTATGGLTD